MNKFVCGLVTPLRMIGVLFLLSIILLVIGLTDQQLQFIRALTGPYSGVDSFVTVIDAPIANQVAYTAPDLKRVYVDFARLGQTPVTAYNVLRHELAHTKGAVHGDGSVEMNYHVTQDMNNRIANDQFFI